MDVNSILEWLADAHYPTVEELARVVQTKLRPLGTFLLDKKGERTLLPSMALRCCRVPTKATKVIQGACIRPGNGGGP